MSDFFAEKAAQVNPGGLESFGIAISSRYSKASELVQMLEFTEQAALNNVAHYVQSVFYDSKACICSFELEASVKEGDPVCQAIEDAARSTVSQFELFGIVGHRYDIEVNMPEDQDA